MWSGALSIAYSNHVATDILPMPQSTIIMVSIILFLPMTLDSCRYIGVIAARGPLAIPKMTLPINIWIGLCGNKASVAVTQLSGKGKAYEKAMVYRITPIMPIQQHIMTAILRPKHQLRGAMTARPIISPRRMSLAMKELYRESVGLPIASKK